MSDVEGDRGEAMLARRARLDLLVTIFLALAVLAVSYHLQLFERFAT